MSDRTMRKKLKMIEALETRLLMSSSHTRVPYAVQTNLVSDQVGQAPTVNANLVNAWGLAAGGQSPFWISDNGSGTSEAIKISGGIYGGGGGGPQTISIPKATGNGGGANPTGIAFNDTGTFFIKNNGGTGAAAYIFSSEDGSLSAWRPPSNGAATSNALKVIDNSASGAVYKGMTIAKDFGSGRSLIFAADFHNNRIDVFDDKFRAVALNSVSGVKPFTDATLPAGYAPFNIAAINKQLYVSYALQNGAKHDDVAGPRHGFVDIYGTDGTLVSHFASKGALDSPWGMVQAPASFGQFAGDILVGNFGNGRISAFNHRGRFEGYVSDSQGKPLEIDGLWGLAFGNGVNAGKVNTLYFAAGPGGEQHGLFGAVDLVLRKHGT